MPESQLSRVQLHLVGSIDDLWAMQAWAGERREGPIGYDTETGGLSAEKDALRLIQLGDLNHGWAVPFALWGGGAMELLTKYQGRLVAHNSSFDNRFLINHAGWQPPWNRIDDTMTAAHIVDPMRSKGLKSLAAKLVDQRAVAGEQILHDGMAKQKWTWATVPLNFAPYWSYAALDPVLTCYVWQKLAPKLSQYSQVYDFEMAVNRVCTMMMLKGILVDVGYINEKLADIRRFSEEARSWLLSTHLVSSPMSGREVAAALKALGQEIVWETEHHFPQIDKEALGYYRDNPVVPAVRELCETILAIRHADKMAGTYLENLLKLRDKNDVVHASIWPLGARTGRMSITEPALQTLPRDDLIVRGAFIPRPGNVLVSSDFGAIEARLSAHFAQDPGLIQAFEIADNDGTDFFSEIATELHREFVPKNDRRRQMIKNMMYCRLYGGGVAKMALTAGVTVREMQPLYDQFNHRYPELNNLTRRVLNAAAAQVPPSVLTPLGRRLVLDQGREATQGVNALIQGHAAEVLKQAMLNLDAAGFGDMMLLPVHDELLFDIPEEGAEEAAQEIRKLMENKNDYAVAITCTPKIMKARWAGGK